MNGTRIQCCLIFLTIWTTSRHRTFSILIIWRTIRCFQHLRQIFTSNNVRRLTFHRSTRSSPTTDFCPCTITQAVTTEASTQSCNPTQTHSSVTSTWLRDTSSRLDFTSNPVGLFNKFASSSKVFLFQSFLLEALRVLSFTSSWLKY